MPATINAAVHAKQIVESLGGRWSGSRGECRCPAHDDRSPSLSVRLGDSAILFHCFAGCSAIDVMKALRTRNLDVDSPIRMPAAVPTRDMSALALRLWKSSKPIAGTLAEKYLAARGLPGPFPGSLRFNPATIFGSGTNRRIMPALIAAVENDLGVVAVQRTFLDPDNILSRPLDQRCCIACLSWYDQEHGRKKSAPGY